MAHQSLPASAVTDVLRVAAELKVILSDAMAQSLCQYVEMMARWNRTYNLTAIRDPRQMLVQHLYDSLSVVAPLVEEAGPGPLKIMDVGSGGGLPGVVLAIVRPDWCIQCVDAVEKKTAFVRQVAGTLKLSNLIATHARIEALPAQGCDVVISRAFASLVDFTEWSGHHVRAHGRMLAMKGRVPDEEIAALHVCGNWRVERLEPLSVPELDGQRCLLWIARNSEEVVE